MYLTAASVTYYSNTSLTTLILSTTNYKMQYDSQQDHEEGFIVTLEGHQPTISEQLRLLPFSSNILCLPPITLPPAPPIREKNDPEERLPPLDPAVRSYILSLHHAHIERLEKARSFLAESSNGGDRMVFLNGGFAGAQAACLKTLRDALMSEENGNIENASREAEWVFEDIMQGGVQGLQEQELEHQQGYSNGDPEEQHVKPAQRDNFERELYPQQLETVATPKNSKMGRSREMSRPRVVSSGPRSPTPEEIEAGIEICKASVAVRVRSRSNTAATHASGLSPPPSPPTVRAEFHLGNFANSESIRKRSESLTESLRAKGSRRKDRDENYTLPPIESMYSMEIPTPPSSAKALASNPKVSQFPAFSDDDFQSPPDLKRPGSRDSARPSSPTPSSTADISGATILPSPRYLSGGFDVLPELSRDPVDPLFPPINENLVIYFPSPEGKKENGDQFLEKVLGDFAVSFTPQTPGVFRANPQMLLIKRNNETQKRYLSPMTALSGQLGNARGRESFQSSMSGGSTATNTTPYSVRSSLLANGHQDPPLASLPTVISSAEKSPVETQNELRAIMRHHFPPPPSPSVSNKDKLSSSEDEDEEDEEDLRWLTGDEEIEQIWRPVLSSRDNESAYSGLDLIVAVGVEEDGDLTESKKGIELRKRFVEQIEEITRKKGSSWNYGNKIGLKYLLSSSLTKVRAQHKSTKDSLVVKGKFLLPELEHYISHNPQIRILVIEFDFYTGSPAILELKRVLGPEINLLKVACVADGVTQISSKPMKSSKSPKVGIRIRTSVNATTISYSLGPGTPTTPNGSLKVPRKPTPTGKRPHIPKQSLISGADMLIPPFTTTSSAVFIDVVEAIHTALKAREKMTGCHGRNQDADTPPTPGLTRIKTPSPDSQQLSRQDTSYYLEEETDEEENYDGKRANFRKRVKNGSKALKWLGLE